MVRSYPYKIRTYQVGGKGQLLLHHLFNILQDVAHRDAMRFGFGFPQMLEHDRLWVLSRMTVELDSLPGYDDDVQIKTWVKSVAGPRSEREFAIVYKNENIIRATGLFYSLSATTFRPADIPMVDRLAELIWDRYAVEGGAEKVENVLQEAEWENKNNFRARYSDIDLLNHVNNASYVKWLMDETHAHYPEKPVQRFSINYLHEVRLGEEIEVRHLEGPEGTLIHELFNPESAKVVCKSKTVWKKA